jgi:DNA-binding Lrp family transcriptional regulator
MRIEKSEKLGVIRGVIAAFNERELAGLGFEPGVKTRSVGLKEVERSEMLEGFVIW